MIIVIGSKTKARIIDCAGYLERCADMMEKEGGQKSSVKECRKLVDWLLRVLKWSIN